MRMISREATSSRPLTFPSEPNSLRQVLNKLCERVWREGGEISVYDGVASLHNKNHDNFDNHNNSNTHGQGKREQSEDIYY